MDGLTAGRIVHYVITESQAKAMNNRRVHNAGHGENWPAGAQAHVGNVVRAGEHIPMMVVRVWSPEGTINGQAFLDGNDTIWVTSATYNEEGDVEGTWHWIERA